MTRSTTPRQSGKVNSPLVASYGLLAASILLAGSMSALSAQPTTISSEPTCPECTITLAPVVTLGDAEGPGAIGSLSTITQLADGRYVASFDETDEELVIFSRDGRFLQRVGRRGEGPGEFEFIRWVQASGDELHVFDAQLARQTVYSSDFKVLRTSRFPGTPIGDVEVVDDSTVVMNTLIRTRDRIGYLLHVLGRDGEILRSLSEEPAEIQYGVSEEVYFRHLSPASSGGVWSGHRTQFTVDEWMLDGTLRSTIVRRAEWFPGHSAEDEGAPDPSRPRNPRLSHVWEDGEGRLWLFARVVDRDWARALAPTTRSDHPEEGGYRIVNLDRAYDTVVEVLDLRTGTLLSSLRVDQATIGFIGDDQIVSRSEDPNGNPRLHVWRVSLHEPQ